ncbi:hypothetical protein IWZ00DRAFT_486056 [Phyllosticta capitalensis]
MLFQRNASTLSILLALSALCSGWGNLGSDWKVKRNFLYPARILGRRFAKPAEIAQPQNNDPNVPNYIGAVPPVPDAYQSVEDAVEAERPQYPPSTEENPSSPDSNAPQPGANLPDDEGLPPMTEGTPLKNIPTSTGNATGLVGSYTTPGVAAPTNTEGGNVSISVSTSGTVEISVTVPVNTSGTSTATGRVTGTGGAAGNRTSDGLHSERMAGLSKDLWIMFGMLWLGLSVGVGLIW